MQSALLFFLFFFFNDTATTEIYTLSLHDALPIYQDGTRFVTRRAHLNVSDNTAEGHEPVEGHGPSGDITGRSEEHTSELQSHLNLVCRLLLEKKKKTYRREYM